MPGTYGIQNKLIKSALKDGHLTQERFDEAVLRNLHLIHRAVDGMKNGDNTADNQLPSSKDDLYKHHHVVAYQAALDCVVLLQNEDAVLPLSSKRNKDGQSATKVALSLIHI